MSHTYIENEQLLVALSLASYPEHRVNAERNILAVVFSCRTLKLYLDEVFGYEVTACCVSLIYNSYITFFVLHCIVFCTVLSLYLHIPNSRKIV